MAESGVDLSYDESGSRPGSSPLTWAPGPEQASSSLPSNSLMIPTSLNGASLANCHQHHSIVPGSNSNFALLPNAHGYAAPVDIHQHRSDVRMGEYRLQASSSCPLIPYRGGRKKELPPTSLTEESKIQWTQERLKKNRHIYRIRRFRFGAHRGDVLWTEDKVDQGWNGEYGVAVERRRRDKINCSIQELAALLPEHYDIDLQNKQGNILEASVDYIRKLKSDEKRLAQMKIKQEQLEQQNHRLQIQLLQMTRNSSQTTQQPLLAPPCQPIPMIPTPGSVNNLPALDPRDLECVFPDDFASLGSFLSNPYETFHAPPTTLGSVTTGVSPIPVMVDEFMEFAI